MQMCRVAAGTLVGLGLVAMVAGVGFAGARSASKPALPCVEIFGPASQQERGFHRIRDLAAWETVWAGHVGAEAATIAGLSTAPGVDFDRYEVIAFFRGPARNIRGERVVSIEEAEDGRRLRFDSSTYQTASMSGEDGGVQVAPFGLWIIDRADGLVVVEENVQNLIGGEPVWRERARLEAGS